jgi:hypothetical protein
MAENGRRRQREDKQATLDQLLAFEGTTYGGKAAEEFSMKGLSSYHGKAVWRERVAMWAYTVVDQLEESRSVVYIAMNILDRHTAKNQTDAPMSERDFEVASMSALFMAVRIAGSGALRLPQLLSMSRLGIESREVVAMGTKMIKSLSWDRRLVTPQEFVKAICKALPPGVETERKQEILDSSSYLVDIAACSLELSGTKASTIAQAAVMNALNAHPTLALSSLNQALEAVMKLLPSTSAVAETSVQLQDLYNQSSESPRSSTRRHLILDDEDYEIPPCVLSDVPQALGTDKSCTRKISYRDDSQSATKKRRVDHAII